MKKITKLGSLLLVVLCLAGCGRSKPSDGNIQDAVKSYYVNSTKSDMERIALFASAFAKIPIGIERDGESSVTGVQIIKRGEPFTPNELQSVNRPICADSKGYPVHVSVKGTVRKRDLSHAGPATYISQSFKGEADFVLWHVPPDKSRFEPGAGTWVACPR